MAYSVVVVTGKESEGEKLVLVALRYTEQLPTQEMRYECTPLFPAKQSRPSCIILEPHYKLLGLVSTHANGHAFLLIFIKYSRKLRIMDYIQRERAAVAQSVQQLATHSTTEV
jgi:hypothetical protein